MKRFVVISGCSGGGKSTLLAELQRRGHAVVEEPGRRIIQEESLRDGRAVPWKDMAAFLRRAMDMALADLAGATTEAEWVFFDRGLIDAAAALQDLTGEPLLATLGSKYHYYPRVFLAPPWPAIYRHDADRRHDLNDAIAEYERLSHAYPSLGYDVLLLPKVGVAERADFVLNALSGACPPPASAWFLHELT